ncbi:hypothetical protein HHK36_009278 [Tetracentron sinense]|uniref:VQ domain-containing protein n=1 Tax=Tetracentron sinense TaxID=13715 RepID=A0A834ZF82_TETSI|nr:hypothetical protein HHK36_009278 [Tetracentron sinense]
MNWPEFPTGNRSPRRSELQGPRPMPLNVRKDSYKIKKPPLAPQPPQHRPPVIIYTVSPKVIHVNPNNFMELVQRLTGSSSSLSSSSSSSSSAITSTSSYFYSDTSGAISPAARFAVTEKTNSSVGKSQSQISDLGMVDGLDVGAAVERMGSFPGILSPVPSSLPPISPNFFSPPPSDPNSLGFLHDLSPLFYNYKNYVDSTFMPSPSTFLSAPITSPTPSLDLFNQFMEL